MPGTTYLGLSSRRPCGLPLSGKLHHQEVALVEAMGRVAFSEFEMRRRVAFFGESYDQTVASALPAFLMPLRIKIAAWTDC